MSGPEAVRSRKSSQTQGGDGLAGLGQHRPHHGGTDAGQDRVDPGVGRRSGGRLMAQVAHPARPHAALEPSIGAPTPIDRRPRPIWPTRVVGTGVIFPRSAV